MAYAAVAVRLSETQIRALCNKHFGDLGKENELIAYGVCYAESDGILNNVGDNFLSGHQAAHSGYRWDRGLMQINSVHKYDEDLLLTDADYNFRAARQIWDKQGWNAWTTYRAGLHVPHMESAPEMSDAAPFFGLLKGSSIQSLLLRRQFRQFDIDPLPVENGKQVFTVRLG